MKEEIKMLFAPYWLWIYLKDMRNYDKYKKHEKKKGDIQL